jgi:D-arabinose 1-dehydrogenase-like Zn-dependent alcohol dehydrogenase
MRAAVLERFGSPLVLAEVDMATAAPGEVIVRTAGCGICRTDLHMRDGLAYRPALPHILGHEPAGRIAALGDGVVDWAIDDAVAPYLFDTCGDCPACRSGNEAQCTETRSILGVTSDGGFAEYFRVRAANLLRVPDAVPLTDAGLVSCAGVTAVRAVARALVAPGQRAAVIGAGGIGLLVVQCLIHRGVDVNVIDNSETMRQASQAEGASIGSVDESASDGTFDRVFDLVATGDTTELAGRLVKRQGRIVIIGEEAEYPRIDTIAIAQREIEIVGSRNGSRADAERALALMATGVLRPRIADRIGLDGINDALDTMRAGRLDGRVIVEFPQ